MRGTRTRVDDGHASSATPAECDSLQQGRALTGRPGAGLGPVGSQLALIGEVGIPADVARVVVGDHDFPVLGWLFNDVGTDVAVGVDLALALGATRYIGARVGGVANDRSGLALA